MTGLFARLYFDEDVSVRVADMLKARGFAVVTTLQAGRLGATDSGQLQFAVAEGRALVTHNRRDFERLGKRVLSGGPATLRPHHRRAASPSRACGVLAAGSESIFLRGVSEPDGVRVDQLPPPQALCLSFRSRPRLLLPHRSRLQGYRPHGRAGASADLPG